MSATVCPNCNKPLSPSVVNGPAQAVVRCEGCQTLLLWSNGRVMRSAKSSTGTMMGLPAVTGKPPAPVTRDAEAPLPELKPEADAAPQPAKPTFPKPPPPAPPATGKTPPPRTATQPMSRPAPPKQTVTGLGDNIPTRVAPPTPELRKEAAKKDPVKAAPATPMKVPPSGPVKLPPAAPAAPRVTAKPADVPKAAEAPKPAEPKPGETPHVVAAVAQVPQMSSGGDMVDPSAWFAGGDVSDVVQPEKLPPIDTTRPARADTTGAQPLPPPPSLPPLEVEPFEIEAPGSERTPAMGTMLPDAASGPIDMNIAAREPSRKVATPPPATPKPMKDLPSARTSIGKAPEASLRSTVMGRPALDLPLAKAEPPKAERAKSEPAKVDPAKSEPAKSEPAKSEPVKAEPARGEAKAEPPKPKPTPKPAEPVAAAVNLLPDATPPKATPMPPASAAPVPNAPTPVAREISAEALPPPPSTLETTTETVLPTVPQPETMRLPREKIPRRTLIIGGGVAAGVLVLALMVIGLSRGSKGPAQAKVAPPAPAVATQTAPTAPAVAPTPTPTPSAPAPTKTPTAEVPTPAAPAPTEPEAVAPVAPVAPRSKRTLGGKKVVLEYDPKPTSPTPPPPTAPTPMGEDPATVARAREAYHRGNVKLFAGDDKGAIDLYRESLKIYPGYVAGYRGLGLAFEEAGQKDDALKAFHTYVRTVPNAVDAAIIRRRIDHLEGRPSQ